MLPDLLLPPYVVPPQREQLHDRLVAELESRPAAMPQHVPAYVRMMLPEPEEASGTAVYYQQQWFVLWSQGQGSVIVWPQLDADQMLSLLPTGEEEY